MKNVVTFVGVLVVDIHWGGLMVNDRSLNDLQPFILFAISRTVPRTASLYQLPNVDKAKLMRIQAWETVWIFVNFGCIICLYFNCSQHTMFIQLVIYFLKYSRPLPLLPSNLKFLDCHFKDQYLYTIWDWHTWQQMFLSYCFTGRIKD